MSNLGLLEITEWESWYFCMLSRNQSTDSALICMRWFKTCTYHYSRRWV